VASRPAGESVSLSSVEGAHAQRRCTQVTATPLPPVPPTEDDIERLVARIGADLQRLEDRLKLDGDRKGKDRFPCGFLRAADHFRKRWWFIRDDTLKRNLAYSLYRPGSVGAATKRSDESMVLGPGPRVSRGGFCSLLVPWSLGFRPFPSRRPAPTFGDRSRKTVFCPPSSVPRPSPLRPRPVSAAPSSVFRPFPFPGNVRPSTRAVTMPP
jgi:hypothetical protein